MPIINKLPQGGGSGKAKLNIFTQMNEPEAKEGIWLKTNDTYVDIVTDSNVWTAGSWIDRGADIPYNFTDGSAVNIGTDIYLLGGYATNTFHRYCYKYNTLTDTYTKMVDIPYNFTDGSAVSIGTDIYLLGGGSSATYKNCYKYNTLTDTYTKMADTPYNFTDGSAVSIGTDIYLLGGYATDTSCRYCYKYNTLTNTYTKMANIPYEFYNGSAVSIGTDIYLFGGSYGRDTFQSCYKYNTLTNTYTKMANIPYEFYHGSAVFVQSRIYTLSGTAYPTYNQIYSLTAKQFSNNVFVIEKVSEYYGEYFTQFHVTPSNLNPANFGRITSGFDNAWIYNNDDLQEYPAYYGNGTAWIKFKN